VRAPSSDRKGQLQARLGFAMPDGNFRGETLEEELAMHQLHIPLERIQVVMHLLTVLSVQHERRIDPPHRTGDGDAAG
jgi:hypothetical protein